MSDELEVLDLAPFLDGSADQDAVQDLARRTADCLRRTGVLILRDPRASTADNETFVSMMERYYGLPEEVKMGHARPDLMYQVGATPAGVEVPRCMVDPRCAEQIAAMPEGHRATLPTGPDVKWRFMWRVGPRPSSTQFPELNAEPVVPQGFPEWCDVMDGWGAKMLAAVEAGMQLAAIGLGLPRDAITSLMARGPHLLAPTGSDLARHAQLGTVLAGVHYDLNLVTIHGRSRFPGLYCWLADGRRVPVRIPPGCLLCQAGRQLEWLTGGAVKAGLHEVVVVPETLAAVEAARAAGRSTWRVSSTVFSHVASDRVLQPLGPYAERPGAAEAYPPTLAGEQVREELALILSSRVGGSAEQAGGGGRLEQGASAAAGPAGRTFVMAM